MYVIRYITHSRPSTIADALGRFSGTARDDSTARRTGTALELVRRMDKEASHVPTAEQSLAMLSDAVGRAAEDLRATRQTLDAARADIASRNTSLPTGDILRESERVVEHLRKADQCLQELVKDLAVR